VERSDADLAPDPDTPPTADAPLGEPRRARVERVLLVCTGNICRSPYVERVLAHELDAAGPHDLRVSSAGTAALEGHPMAEPMLARLRRRGIDGSDFRARQLSAAMVEHAGLVVTAAREHRRWVTRLVPHAASRTFTLLQLARLAEAASEDELAWTGLDDLVQRLNLLRGSAGAGSSSDDLEDPWRRSAWTYRRVGRRIDAALEPVVAMLSRGR